MKFNLKRLTVVAVPLAALASGGQGHAVSSPPHPMTRLGVPTSGLPELVRWDAAGRRVLWEVQAATFRGLQVEGLTTVRKVRRVLWRRTGRGPCLVRLPVWGPSPVIGDDVVAVRVKATFAAAQRGAPQVRARLQTVAEDGGQRWTEWPMARADSEDGTWWLELGPAPGRGLHGVVSELAIELLDFAGDSLELRRVEILSRGQTEGPLALFEEGETRRVYATPAGTAFEARALAPRNGRLTGELARHPADRSVAGAVTAEMTLSAGDREIHRSFRLAAGPTAWVGYEIPLPAEEGAEVTVRLAGDEHGGVVWTPPALVAAKPGGRGVVLISIDTLRADAVFPLDRRRPLMPRLAARARRQGQTVWHHYSAANWTLPAHASMLTGRYPASHGANDGDAVLDLSAGASLPALLGANGFFTAGIVDGGYVAASYGFGQRFDRYRESPPGPRRLSWHTESYRALLPQLRESDFFLFVHSYFIHDYYDPDSSAEAPPVLPGRLEAFAGRHRGGLLATAQAREPATPLDPRFTPLMQTLYAQRAEVLDRWLDGFLDSLERDFATPPLVVVTGDHGECLGDDPAHLYWHHGTTTREEEIRVPLVILRPDRRPRPDVADLTSQVDVTPTILRLLGISTAPGAYEGVDLLDPQALRSRQEVYCANYSEGRNSWTAVGRRVKLVEERGLGAASRHGATRVLYRGQPSTFESSPAQPAEGAEVRAIERRSRDALYSGVDGLYIQADNPTETPQELVVELAAPAPAPFASRMLGLAVPLQVHFLEPSDSETLPTPGQPASFSLSLGAGDTDLIVVKANSDLQLRARSVQPGVAIQIGSERAAGTGPFLVGRLRSPVAGHPPSLRSEARGAVLRIWENEPPGSPRYAPRQQPISGRTYERLRALGYIN